MKYIALNYGLNKTFNIHKYVFYQATKNVAKAISGFHLVDEIEIDLVEKNTNIEIHIPFKLSAKADLEETVSKLLVQLNEQIKGLIGVHPQNIQLNYKGRK